MTRAATRAVLIVAGGSHTAARSYSGESELPCEMLTVPLLTCVERDRKRFGANGRGVWRNRKPLATRSRLGLWDLCLPRLIGMVGFLLGKPLSDLLFE